MASMENSPLTGIIAEDKVIIDFGEHEGKSVMEIGETHPDFYSFLCEQKDKGSFTIRRCKDKQFRLYLPGIHLN